MQHLDRRHFIGSSIAMSVGSLPSLSWAQPTRPIRLVVPFPAGGAADFFPRVVAAELQRKYPAGVVVENKAGAGGNIGAQDVYSAAPDGLTFLASPPGPLSINRHLFKSMPFDSSRFVAVTMLATAPAVLAVRPDFPARTLREFVAHARANPGKVSFASQGNGSTGHLVSGMFMQVTGTDLLHAPYRGSGPALIAVMGSQVDAMFDNVPTVQTHHREGKLRVIGVAARERTPALQDVETFAEAGMPDMVAHTWFAVAAPPGTPSHVVRTLQEDIAEIVGNPEIRKRFLAQGGDPQGWTPERTQQFIAEESVRWQRVIQNARISVE